MNKLEKLLGLTSNKTTHPPIHWAGGKSKLIKYIKPHLNGNRLIDVFMGSTIVSLNAIQDEIILNDINKDLISLFTTIKDDKEMMIESCLELFQHKTKEDYLRVREQFNSSTNEKERASLFLYLNRFGFNGLCRYSSNGNYNVAWGGDKKVNPPIQEIKDVSKILNEKNTTFTNLNFLDAMDLAKENDVVYLDPPYVPLTISSHTNYSGEGFSLKNQEELRDKVLELKEKNVKSIVSNHDTDYTRELYKDANKIIEVELYRPISGSKEHRVKAKELIAIFGE